MGELKDRLKEARLEAGLNQAQLAKRAGLKNQSNVGNLENGHRKSTTYIAQLAKALNVEPLWLSEGKGPKRHDDGEKKISDELSAFLGIPKALCTMEMVEQVQAFAKESEERRTKALNYIDQDKTKSNEKHGKGKESDKP